MINENDYNKTGGGVIIIPEPPIQWTGGGENNKQMQ